MCEDLLEEILQSAQMQGGVFASVWAVSLAPTHRFVQPEPQLPGARRALCCLWELDQWLRLRHFVQVNVLVNEAGS